MATMLAAYLTGHGGNEVVALGERPVPQRRHGEVLVRMVAGGLNRVDLYMRNSGAGITHSLPQVLGLDGVGIVEDADDDHVLPRGARVILHPGVGCGHCEFCRRGDNVLCTSMKLLGEHRDGTLSGFVCLPASNVFALPEGLSFEDAVSLPVSFLTAWRMIHTKGTLKPWETVLIFGIGGSVSLSALQLAKAMGARAIVTSRDPAKLQRAVELGADHAVNGATQDIARRVLEITGGRGVDMVFENVGEAVWPHAMKSLVRGGRIVTCGATSGEAPSADLRRLFIRQLQVIGSTHGTLAEFADLVSFMADRPFAPVFDSWHGITGIHGALDRLESGRQFGKIGISIGDAA